jgi:uncharacterized membrane protein HdeD (DUF308 family)
MDTQTMMLERRRTVWDVILGLIAVVAGLVVLGHVAIASLVSILFIGWMLLISGVMLAIAGIVGWRQPVERWNVAAGAVLAILGFGFVRNPGAGLLVLTLLAGSLLLIGGIIRLVAAFQPGAPRMVLLLNGIVTLFLGIMVVNQWPSSALWLLGTVLGVQLVIDGMTTALVGRIRQVEPTSGPPASTDPVTIDVTEPTTRPQPRP